MRTRTFLLSFLVHSTLIGAAMVVRIVATTELPDPPRSTSFMIAAAETPQVEPPPAPRAPSTAPAVNRNAAPLEAPQSIATEPLDVFDVPPTDAVGTIPGAPGDVPGALLGPRPSEPAPRVTAPHPQPPVRPGGIVRPPQKVHHVGPEYPAIARSAGVSGVVILEALIREDGSVSEVKVLRSVRLLDASAVEAVRQWRFTPTLLNGVPVQVIMTVTVSFTLS